MSTELYDLETEKLFSKSILWQLNRDFYNFRGLSAFSDETVPHHLTSNSLVGETYAELIFGLLKDLANKGQSQEIVYILELGAGHGRLAFLILAHLENLIQESNLKLPPFCYVLSDIVEENLSFFLEHPQFQVFFQKGILDVAYFDAIENKLIELRFSKKIIRAQELKQPIVAVANYFFDSIPNELYLVKDKTVSDCLVSLQYEEDPLKLNPEELIEKLQLVYQHLEIKEPGQEHSSIGKMLERYQDELKNTYLFYPKEGIRCLKQIKKLSKEGLVLLSLDKGFYKMADLDNFKIPDVVTHGSFSIWVNYHALGAFCEKEGGQVFFPNYSNFHFVLGAFLFLNDSELYLETKRAYQKNVEDFGPDDFNTLKKQSYSNAARLSTKEMIALFRLSKYDPTFFTKLLPRLKQVSKNISLQERERIAETMHLVWELYFDIGESYDLAYEMAGIFYDLGYYKEALQYFESSESQHGEKADTYYNMALSYYQLREDSKFYTIIKKAKLAFPNFELFSNLEKLEMN